MGQDSWPAALPLALPPDHSSPTPQQVTHSRGGESRESNRPSKLSTASTALHPQTSAPQPHLRPSHAPAIRITPSWALKLWPGKQRPRPWWCWTGWSQTWAAPRGVEHMEGGNRLVELTNLLLQNPSQPAVAQLLRWVVPAGVCASGSTCGSMWQRARCEHTSEPTVPAGLPSRRCARLAVGARRQPRKRSQPSTPR